MKADERELLEMKAAVFQAIAHPIRLAIVELLADGEMCVCDIAGGIEATRSNVSRHLSMMLAAGVLQVRKDGLKMIYSLRTPCVVEFLGCVTRVVRTQLKRRAAILARL
jgi:DNA-binding transcriptional ArsR family regulator